MNYNKYFDHTMLAPQATSTDIDKLIKEVNLNRFYSYILLEIKEYPELWYYNDVENYYFENVWKKENKQFT